MQYPELRPGTTSPKLPEGGKNWENPKLKVIDRENQLQNMMFLTSFQNYFAV